MLFGDGWLSKKYITRNSKNYQFSLFHLLYIFFDFYFFHNKLPINVGEFEIIIFVYITGKLYNNDNYRVFHFIGEKSLTDSYEYEESEKRSSESYSTTITTVTTDSSSGEAQKSEEFSYEEETYEVEIYEYYYPSSSESSSSKNFS